MRSELRRSPRTSHLDVQSCNSIFSNSAHSISRNQRSAPRALPVGDPKRSATPPVTRASLAPRASTIKPRSPRSATLPIQQHRATSAPRLAGTTDQGHPSARNSAAHPCVLAPRTSPFKPCSRRSATLPFKPCDHRPTTPICAAGPRIPAPCIPELRNSAARPEFSLGSVGSRCWNAAATAWLRSSGWRS